MLKTRFPMFPLRFLVFFFFFVLLRANANPFSSNDGSQIITGSDKLKPISVDSSQQVTKDFIIENFSETEPPGSQTITSTSSNSGLSDDTQPATESNSDTSIAPDTNISSNQQRCSAAKTSNQNGDAAFEWTDLDILSRRSPLQVVPDRLPSRDSCPVTTPPQNDGKRPSRWGLDPTCEEGMEPVCCIWPIAPGSPFGNLEQIQPLLEPRKSSDYNLDGYYCMECKQSSFYLSFVVFPSKE